MSGHIYKIRRLYFPFCAPVDLTRRYVSNHYKPVMKYHLVCMVEIKRRAWVYGLQHIRIKSTYVLGSKRSLVWVKAKNR